MGERSNLVLCWESIHWGVDPEPWLMLCLKSCLFNWSRFCFALVNDHACGQWTHSVLFQGLPWSYPRVSIQTGLSAENNKAIVAAWGWVYLWWNSYADTILLVLGCKPVSQNALEHGKLLWVRTKRLPKQTGDNAVSGICANWLGLSWKFFV